MPQLLTRTGTLNRPCRVAGFASESLAGFIGIRNASFVRSNFGITPLEATRSGFAAYHPSGGLTEVAAGATAGFQLSRHRGLLVRAQAGTYLGDASKSPIVKDGSKSFHLFALGLGYKF